MAIKVLKTLKAGKETFMPMVYNEPVPEALLKELEAGSDLVEEVAEVVVPKKRTALASRK